MGNEVAVQEPKLLTDMTLFEAKECVAKIKANVQNIRKLFLELNERRGWEALGYKSWRECVVKEFGGKQAYAYFQLSAAKVERNISTIVEKSESIPESHLRPLTKLPPEEQREVFQEAVETAPNGKVTAKHIEKTIQEYKQTETYPVSDAMTFIVLQH